MPFLMDLPVELLHTICSYCAKADIRSVRLTSRLLATIGDEHFLDEAVIFFAREDFEQTENIVNNSRIAKNIKRLTFQTDRVPWLGPHFALWNEFRKQSMRSIAAIGSIKLLETSFVPDETDRERRHRMRQPNRTLVLEENKYSRKELRAAFEHYNLLSEDQNEMMLENRAEECIKHLFRQCVKLETVVVAMNDHHPAWRNVDAFRKGMIHPCGDNATSRLGVRSLNEVLMAARATRRKLSSLEVYPISFQFFAQDKERMEQIYEAISSLIDIKLKINDKIYTDREMNIEFDDDDDEETMAMRVEQFERQAELESYQSATERVIGSFRDGRLALFLSKAPLLKRIAVAGISTIIPESMMRLEDIVISPQWSAIEMLALHCFQCSQQALVDLILQYRESLRELRLGQILLNTGDPNNLFQALAGQCPKLTRVELSGKFISPDMNYKFEHCLASFKIAVEAYLISGGVMPCLRDFTAVRPEF